MLAEPLVWYAIKRAWVALPRFRPIMLLIQMLSAGDAIKGHNQISFLTWASFQILRGVDVGC